MKLIKFLVYSNSWISLGAGFLTLLSFNLFNSSTESYTELSYSLFVFFSTLFSYNFQRVSRLKKIAEHSPNAWVVNNSSIAITFLFLSILGSLAFLPIFQHPFVFLWILILGIISFGYSYGKFRDLPYLKILLISASWAIACGIIPSVIANNEPLTDSLLTSFWIFFYILGITIPFDIRDIGIDEDSKKTIPQWVGIKQSKQISYISLFLAFVLFLLLNGNIGGSIVMFISMLIASFLVKKSEPYKNDLYFTLLIDGHIIFQFLLVYFLC